MINLRRSLFCFDNLVVDISGNIFYPVIFNFTNVLFQSKLLTYRLNLLAKLIVLIRF